MSTLTWMTSKEAFEWYRDSGQISKREMEIMQAMKNREPMNQRMILEEVRQMAGNSEITEHAITPRFRPLVRVNLIRVVGTMKCPFTSRTTATYQLTYQKPTGDLREARQAGGKRRLKELETENERLRIRVEELEARISEMKKEKGQMSWAM